MNDRETLDSTCAAIKRASGADRVHVQAHLDNLTKPVGSLGRLEALALRLALIYGDPPGPFVRRTIYVLAADHGVANRGVSAYPPEVTAQMCRNYVAGGAAINVLARTARADVVTVDMGVDADLGDVPGVLDRKIRRGSRDLSVGPAMTGDEVLRALAVGIELAKNGGTPADIIALGDMGIGNTTSASALTAALIPVSPGQVVGPGTGIDATALDRKRQVVEKAVRRLNGRNDPLEILAEVGGLEIAGLCGIVLGAASLGRAVITDGFITTAAVLTAARICPPCVDYVIASHQSTEPGHRMQLAALGLEPVFDLNLRLGEGTGAALALPMVDAAAALLREMATFTSAGVSVKRE